MTRDRDPMEVAMLAELNPVAAHLFAHLPKPHDVADDEPHPATHDLEESA